MFILFIYIFFILIRILISGKVITQTWTLIHYKYTPIIIVYLLVITHCYIWFTGCIVKYLNYVPYFYQYSRLDSQKKNVSNTTKSHSKLLYKCYIWITSVQIRHKQFEFYFNAIVKNSNIADNGPYVNHIKYL
jgi:hypothetical protein